MKQPFQSITLSHSHAPVEIREKMHFSEDRCKVIVAKLGEFFGILEALVISTCNRTEIYFISEEDLGDDIIKLLCIENGIHQIEQILPHFIKIKEEEVAVKHLFEVSMGLHSKVLGDLQISHQIKQSYRISHEASMAGAYLHRLMHTIFHANKRVQHETPYRDGAASASYAAAELAVELSEHLLDPKILILGLGEMGRDVARNLDADAFESVFVSNRTISKANEIAFEKGFSVLPLEVLPERISEFDVIVSSLSVDKPYLTSAFFERCRLRSQFIIDLSVPRSVSSAVSELSNVQTYNIDDIFTRTSLTIRRRKSAIAQVEDIIQEEAEGFFNWRSQLTLSPTIRRIKDALEQVRKEELARFLKNATKQEEELLKEVTQSMINKILKMPVLQLKAACRRGNPETLIDVLNELFDLEAAKKKLNENA